MKLRQGDHSNEDFIKLVSKELKIYEKHGGDFLWGKPQEKVLTEFVQTAKTNYKASNSGADMTSEEEAKEIKRIKHDMKQNILAMVILK